MLLCTSFSPVFEGSNRFKNPLMTKVVLTQVSGVEVCRQPLAGWSIVPTSVFLLLYVNAISDSHIQTLLQGQILSDLKFQINQSAQVPSHFWK